MRMQIDSKQNYLRHLQPRKWFFQSLGQVTRRLALIYFLHFIKYTWRADATQTGENHIGRRVVVVGASYGIGRATADLLSDRGASVVYASRTKTLLDDAVNGRKKCYSVVMDVSCDKSIQEGMERAASCLGGKIDSVVYCPGYFGQDSYGSFERLFESGDFESGFAGSIQAHLKGMMSTFRYSRKYMLSHKDEASSMASANGDTFGPSFIALSSIAGSMGHPGAALYAIAKAAVDMAVKQLALEYAPQGLRVLSVAPGLIDTPAINNLGPDKQRFLNEVGASHAMKRYASTPEVAEVIAFLCSERASFMTGNAPLYVDGGCMLRSSLGDALRSFTVDARG